MNSTFKFLTRWALLFLYILMGVTIAAQFF